MIGDIKMKLSKYSIIFLSLLFSLRVFATESGDTLVGAQFVQKKNISKNQYLMGEDGEQYIFFRNGEPTKTDLPFWEAAYEWTISPSKFEKYCHLHFRKNVQIPDPITMENCTIERIEEPDLFNPITIVTGYYTRMHFSDACKLFDRLSCAGNTIENFARMSMPLRSVQSQVRNYFSLIPSANTAAKSQANQGISKDLGSLTPNPVSHQTPSPATGSGHRSGTLSPY